MTTECKDIVLEIEHGETARQARDRFVQRLQEYYFDDEPGEDWAPVSNIDKVVDFLSMSRGEQKTTAAICDATGLTSDQVLRACSNYGMLHGVMWDGMNRNKRMWTLKKEGL